MQPNITRYIIILVLVVSALGETRAHGWGGRGRGRAMRRPMAAGSVRSAACQTCKQPQQQAASPTIINHIIVNGDGQTGRGSSLVAANSLASQALINNHHGQYNSESQQHASHGNHESYGDKLSGVAHELGQAFGGGGGSGSAGGASSGGMSKSSSLSGFVAAGAKLAGLGAARSGGGLAALAAGGAAQALSGGLGGGGGRAGGRGHGSGRALINGLVRNFGGTSGARGGQLGALGGLGAAALKGALARGRGGGSGGHLEGHTGHQQQQQQQQHSGRHSSDAHLLPEVPSGSSSQGQSDYMPEGSEQYAGHGQHGGRHDLAGHGGPAGLSYEGASDLQYHHGELAGHGSGRETHGGHGNRHESYVRHPRSDLEGEYQGHDTQANHGATQHGPELVHASRNDRPAASKYYEQGERSGVAHTGHAQQRAAQEGRQSSHRVAKHQPQEYEKYQWGGHADGRHERGYENAHGREHADGAGYEQDRQMMGHAIEGGQHSPAGYEGGPVPPYGHRGDQSAGGQYDTELDGLDTGAYEDLVDEYGAPIISKLHDKYDRYATGGFEGHGARGHGAHGAHDQQAQGAQYIGQYTGAEGVRGRSGKISLDPFQMKRSDGTYVNNLARGATLDYGTAARYADGSSGQQRYQPSRGETCGQCRDCSSCKMPARGPPSNYRVMEPAEDDYPVTSAAASSSASVAFME